MHVFWGLNLEISRPSLSVLLGASPVFWQEGWADVYLLARGA